MMICLLCAPHEGVVRPIPTSALAIFILVLFPIVTLAVDLEKAQNLLEDKFYLIQSFTGASSRSAFRRVDMLPSSEFTESSLALLRFDAVGPVLALFLNDRCLATVMNRRLLLPYRLSFAMFTFLFAWIAEKVPTRRWCVERVLLPLLAPSAVVLILLWFSLLNMQSRLTLRADQGEGRSRKLQREKSRESPVIMDRLTQAGVR